MFLVQLEGIGSRPCFTIQDCELYSSLSPEQVKQLSTPTYKIKKKNHFSEKGLLGSSSATVLHPID